MPSGSPLLAEIARDRKRPPCAMRRRDGGPARAKNAPARRTGPRAINRRFGTKHCDRWPAPRSNAQQRASLQGPPTTIRGFGQLVARVLDPQPATDRPAPDDLDAWIHLLDGPADADEGRADFSFSRRRLRIGAIPSMAAAARSAPICRLVGRALDQRRLIESILRPSKEIAPQL